MRGVLPRLAVFPSLFLSLAGPLLTFRLIRNRRPMGIETIQFMMHESGPLLSGPVY